MAAEGFGKINVTVDARLLNLADEFAAQCRAIVDEESLNLAVELEARSPVGATKQLSQGWDIQQTSRRRNNLDLRFRIVNNADAALFRLRGRPAGRMPPSEALEQWVRVKLRVDPQRVKSVAFLVARKIAREGTKRYKEQDNILGIDPSTGELKPDSPVRDTERAIASRINALQLPKRSRGRR